MPWSERTRCNDVASNPFGRSGRPTFKERRKETLNERRKETLNEQLKETRNELRQESGNAALLAEAGALIG